VFVCGPIMLRVTLVDSSAPRPFTVLGWSVPDIRAVLRRLAESGVAATRYDGMDQDPHGLRVAPAGELVAWFTDPDGNTLSLTQFLAPNDSKR
jgi:hypothetical protein